MKNCHYLVLPTIGKVVKTGIHITSIMYETIPILRQKKDLVGGFKKIKMAVFTDVQYCICANTVSKWVRKNPKKYADVILGWSLRTPN